MVEDTDTSCGRCGGSGNIPRFAHVMGGVCFRCWGSGDDPRSAEQLARWLAKARQEYRARLQALREAPSPEAEKAIRMDLSLIARLGKANKAKLARLEKPCPACVPADLNCRL